MNAALRLIKAKARTNNIDTETTIEALMGNQYFEDTLDEILSEHSWNFATFRAELAQSATTPEYEYEYYYALPNNPYCITVVEAVNSDAYEVDDYEVENGRYIATDSATLKIKYIGRSSNYTQLPPKFKAALIYLLASKFATAFTNNVSMSERMYGAYELQLRKAKTHDAKQGTPELEKDTDYEFKNARFRRG